MKIIISFLIFLISPLFLLAQELTVTEESETIECGKTLRVDGIWIDNGVIKADISILSQKNSKPITGGYSIGDFIDIKKDCRYYIREIVKYGLKSNFGHVAFIKEEEFNKYQVVQLSNLKLNEKFNVGYSEWVVKRISKDDADFEVEVGLNKKTVTLKKNDLIWTGYGAYYISDFLANASDIISDQWTIELKEVKDYSYLNPNTICIPGDDINAPHTLPRGETELIIRKMKYHPNKKIDEEELKNIPVKYWVLKVLYYHGGIARHVIEVERDGKKMFLEYDAYKSFDTEEEALEFAKVNKITDVMLEEK